MSEEHIKLGNAKLGTPDELEAYVERAGINFPCEVDVKLQEGEFDLFDVTHMGICDHTIMIYTGSEGRRRAVCMYQATSFDIDYDQADRIVTLTPYNSLMNNYHGQDL